MEVRKASSFSFNTFHTIYLVTFHLHKSRNSCDGPLITRRERERERERERRQVFIADSSKWQVRQRGSLMNRVHTQWQNWIRGQRKRVFVLQVTFCRSRGDRQAKVTCEWRQSEALKGCTLAVRGAAKSKSKSKWPSQSVAWIFHSRELELCICFFIWSHFPLQLDAPSAWRGWCSHVTL